MCVWGGGGCEDVSWIRSDVWYILCVDNYFTGTGQTSVLQECSQGPATSLDPGGGPMVSRGHLGLLPGGVQHSKYSVRP